MRTSVCALFVLAVGCFAVTGCGESESDPGFAAHKGPARDAGGASDDRDASASERSSSSGRGGAGGRSGSGAGGATSMPGATRCPDEGIAASILKDVRTTSGGIEVASACPADADKVLMLDGDLEITQWDSAEMLDCFRCLREITVPPATPGGLHFHDNAMLKHTRFENLTKIEGELGFRHTMIESAEFHALMELGSLNLSDNSLTDLTFGSLAKVGSVSIGRFVVLSDLSLLSGVREIGAIHLDDDLALIGLESLTRSQVLQLASFTDEDMSVLSQLSAVDILQIGSAPNLTSLHGLEKVTALKGLAIQYNPKLETLTGLQHLAGTVNEGITITDNPVLTDITALDQVRNGAKEWTLTNNPMLSTCAVNEMIAKHQGMTIRACGNAPDCGGTPCQ
jgi:hypothetical protein